MLDASVALAWLLPEERSEAAGRAMARIDREDAVWVPALWWYEVANALTTGRRQKRLSEADCGRAIATYEGLGLQIDAGPDSSLAWRLHSLGAEHGLSAYDAAYVELAQRRGATLLSVDARLSRAAARAGLRVEPRP